MIPTPDEINKFREKLKGITLDQIQTNVRNSIWGVKDSWKNKEAEVNIRAQDDANKAGLKIREIDEAVKGNQLLEQANKIARWALGISLLALIISILAIYK